MKKVTNPKEVINQLMTENDKILFNLFYLIADSENAFWVTDDKSYIIGQTNERLPMWIWIKDTLDEGAEAEIKSVLLEKLAANPKLKITAEETKIRKLLDQVSQETFSQETSFPERNVRYEASVPMNIYACKKVTNPKKASGHVILSNESHKPVLEKFITGMVHDLEHRPMEEGEAEGFANAVAGSEDLFLWEDEGTVTSMAMIVHRTEEFARINTVYMDSEKRGQGYAGMLVGEVTQKILDENKIPMLYTEQDNVCSNATYKRIGYNLCGELTQFVFCNCSEPGRIV